MGWRAMDPEDSEPMAVVWIEALNRAGIPRQSYLELYYRCIELRARRLTEGLECDGFSVDMMISCWPSLQKEIREREINAGRTLTSNAASGCPHCLGSGMRYVDPANPGQGIEGRCDHQNR